MKRGIRAYFTIEAVLVLPLVIVAIGVILYLLLYQYDRCILEQDMGMLSVRLSSTTLPQEDVIPEFGRLQQGIAREKYLMCTMDEPEQELRPGQVKVSGGIQMTFPLAGPKGGSTVTGIKTTYENHRLSPLFIIRSCEKVKTTWNKGEE